MGRIFSFEEIENKQIPSRENFSRVIEILKDDLQGKYSSGSIRAALLCGSVLKGEHSRRSDLDCLIVYNEENRSLTLGWMQEFHRTARIHSVPMQFIPVSDAVANTPLCHIEAMFASHLHWAIKNGGVIRGDPSQFLKLDYQSPEDDFRNYLRYKMRAMEVGQVAARDSDHSYYSWLSKGVESPIHVARKVLQIKKVLPEEDIPSLNKYEIVEFCHKYVGEVQGNYLRWLMALDREYDEELDSQLKAPDKTGYFNFLASLENNACDAAKFICHVATTVR